METNENEPGKHEKNVVPAINNNIGSPTFVWNENITVIDLSGRNIVALDNNVILPRNLISLDLSRNELTEVPKIVLILGKLEVLNLSHNAIKHFNDCPEFCHTLKLLDMSENCLLEPPHWIWVETPRNLSQLNLSNNINITKAFVNGYFEELLQYKTLVTEVNLQNCRLGKFTNLLNTFPNAKSLCLGSENYTINVNSIIEIPCNGLDKCCELESLKLCNTNIYTINPSIEMYKSLVEINLAGNDIAWLPNEFCNLQNLEICVLSSNKIVYLPDDIYQLQKLSQLYLDSNEICMIPDAFDRMHLKMLDLYDNYLEDVPNLDYLDELDLALNYLEEPDDSDYLEKRNKLRLTQKNRNNGSKKKIIKSDNESSETSTSEDDEELHETFYNGINTEAPTGNIPSSSEDWDSDSYWEPCTEPPYQISRVKSPWLIFVEQKMKEGNFCPLDAHVASAMEKVKYKRSLNPHVLHESEGQFDDCSSDS